MMMMMMLLLLLLVSQSVAQNRPNPKMSFFGKVGFFHSSSSLPFTTGGSIS